MQYKKPKIKNVFNGAVAKILLVSAVFMPFGASLHAQQAQAPRPNVPGPQAPTQLQLPAQEALVIMIRSSIVALSQANVTNNYTVLNALGSRNFRAANSPARLANVFQSYRANRIDLSPVVFLNPQLIAQPTISNGKLRLIGIFPSKPLQVNFDLTFEPEDGVWKILGLSVNLSQAPAPKTPPNQ